MTPAVLDVAVLAGVGIEQGPQPVARSGSGRGDHPRAAEKTVADTEIQTPCGRQVGRGHRKRILIGFTHRRGPTGAGFARLGFGKARGVITTAKAKGQEQQRQAKRQRRHQASSSASKIEGAKFIREGELK